jgi:hypothetical protein
MEEPTIRRITVERESDWLRVQENIGKGLQKSLDARLATLPGGRDGPAAKGVKRELEERIKKVCWISMRDVVGWSADGRFERRPLRWQNRIYA